jgi:hypothetical protein
MLFDVALERLVQASFQAVLKGYSRFSNFYYLRPQDDRC